MLFNIWRYRSMNQKTITVGILFIILSCGYGGIAQQAYNTDNFFDKGRFTAELGLGRDENPDIALQGSFKIRGRIRVISGSYEATNSERFGRFGGQIYGNHFIVVLFHGADKQVLYGRIRVNEDQNDFYGFWRGRGTERSGWISGRFI